jgi:hypothetical protein
MSWSLLVVRLERGVVRIGEFYEFISLIIEPLYSFARRVSSKLNLNQEKALAIHFQEVYDRARRVPFQFPK